MFRIIGGIFILLTVCSDGLLGQAADTIRLMHYNLLRFGQAGCLPLTQKHTLLGEVYTYVKPDLVTVNEMPPYEQLHIEFLEEVLGLDKDWGFAGFSNSNGSDLVNSLFYNQEKLGFLGRTSIVGNVRDIDVYHLYVKSASSLGDTLDFYCFVAHFKSSQGGSNIQARAESAADIVNWLSIRPQVTRYVLSGDLNLYSNAEAAWQILGISFEDPTGLTGNWVGPAGAVYHTQSPSDGINLCAVEGGMDDRFDFTLLSPALMSDLSVSGLGYQDASYRVIGNIGNAYNVSLNCSMDAGVPEEVCSALRSVSDHLPVVLNLVTGGNFPAGTSISEAGCFRLSGNFGGTGTIILHREGIERGAFNWQVMDISGRFIRSGVGLDRVEISVDGLAFGVYVILAEDDTGCFWRQVCIRY